MLFQEEHQLERVSSACQVVLRFSCCCPAASIIVAALYRVPVSVIFSMESSNAWMCRCGTQTPFGENTQFGIGNIDDGWTTWVALQRRLRQRPEMSSFRSQCNGDVSTRHSPGWATSSVAALVKCAGTSLALGCSCGHH